MNKKIGGSFESSLIINVLGSRGRSIALGLGIYLNYYAAFKRCALLKTYKVLAAKVHEAVIMLGIAALYGYHIAFSRSNLVPNESFGSFIKAEAAYTIKLSGIYEYVGGGRSEAFRNCGNGELDTVSSHSTVCKVKYSGSTVIKCSVIVLGVAANYGNEVLLCIFNSVKNKS